MFAMDAMLSHRPGHLKMPRPDAYALAAAALDEHCALAPAAAGLLQSAAARLGWSGRSFHRVLRVARSIADLNQHDTIELAHLAEAIQYRRSPAAP